MGPWVLLVADGALHYNGFAAVVTCGCNFEILAVVYLLYSVIKSTNLKSKYKRNLETSSGV